MSYYSSCNRTGTYHFTPYNYLEKCPVCLGRGKVFSTFYDLSQNNNNNSNSEISETICKTCFGTGIVHFQYDLNLTTKPVII